MSPFPCHSTLRPAPCSLHLHPVPATSSPNSHGVNRGSSVSWRPRFCSHDLSLLLTSRHPATLLYYIRGIAA